MNPSRTLIFSAVFLTWLSHFIVDFMIGIWPVYKSIIHIDLAWAGLIVAGGAFLGEGSQFFFGSLSDRGYRKALIMAGFVAATSNAFLAYCQHPILIFFLYLFTCIGSGAFHPSAASFMGTLIPERRGLLMAIFASGGGLGLACSQLIFFHVYRLFNGQTFYLIFPTLLLFFAFFALKHPEREPVSERPSFKKRLKEMGDFFKQEELRLLYFTVLANQTVMWGMIFILPDALLSLGHPEWICLGGGHLFLILGSALMMVPGGYLSDKYSPRTVMWYATLISFAAFYLILFTGHLSIPIVLSLLFVLGASLGTVLPVAVALGTRLVPERPGAISAFLMGMVWCLSEAIGPGGVGIMTRFFEDQAPLKALAILGGFFLLNIYATAKLPKESELLTEAA